MRLKFLSNLHAGEAKSPICYVMLKQFSPPPLTIINEMGHFYQFKKDSMESPCSLVQACIVFCHKWIILFPELKSTFINSMYLMY